MKLSRRPPAVLLVGLIAAGCTSSSPAPAGTIVPTAAIADAAVQVLADGCTAAETHGAGLMVAPGRVATVAHVVAGATTISVRGRRGTGSAKVVYFDPIVDVAVLQVDPELALPIPVGDAAAGDTGDVIVYRDDLPVKLPADVRRLVQIRTADIYGEGKHLRPGYELNLHIKAGDSGAVVVVGGKAVALVWATSREVEARAWAMRTSLIADHLTASNEVDHGHCP
jgi:S1-C subfamily serine protease